MSDDYRQRIGRLIRDARRHKGLTQSELARLLSTSQSAVARIEQGQQNLSLEMVARIGEALDSEFVSLGHSGPQHLRIVDETPLALPGTVEHLRRNGPIRRAEVAVEGLKKRLEVDLASQVAPAIGERIRLRIAHGNLFAAA